MFWSDVIMSGGTGADLDFDDFVLCLMGKTGPEAMKFSAEFLRAKLSTPD